MKLKAKLMLFTAAAALTGTMAFAAIDGNDLADRYLAAGYSWVEVKVGPTQTKLEAIKGNAKVEVIYDNESGKIVKQEQGVADPDERARVGKEVRPAGDDFDDEGDDSGKSEDDDESDDDHEDDSDDSGDDDHEDDDSGDDDHEDDGDDHEDSDDGDDGDDDSDSGEDD